MSRDHNHLQRHIQDCLADRRDPREAPEQYLIDHELDDEGFCDDWELDCDFEDGWYEDSFFDQCDEYDDDGSYWEPQDLEYGGRYYPAEHVQDARCLREHT